MLWSCIVRPTKPFVNDGFGNQFDAPDNASYQCLQMHGCIAVKNDELGYISVLLIGMAQISSVQLHNKPGDWLKKSDEIAHFGFGGSDIVIVFQAGAVV